MFTLGADEIIIGLGSNSSDALEMLRRARRALRSHPRFRLLSLSPIYLSEALLPKGAPPEWDIPYLNSACLLEWCDSDGSFGSSNEEIAGSIVGILKDIESSMGRVEAPRWAPRKIDLDLLAWGRGEVKTAFVSVPHSGLMDRPFALLPALDCVRGRRGASSDHPPHAWRFAPIDEIPQRTRIAPVNWPEVVGILNVTPDSFSDGRTHVDPSALERAVREMIAGGATVIDIGAESTRPGASEVSWRAELERLEAPLGVLTRLREELSFRLSLDSRHPETVAECMRRFPIDWVNDVEGFSNPKMIEVILDSKCQCVVMHSLGVPPSPNRVIPPSRDPVIEILTWGERRIQELAQRGIARDRMIFDPGIGFGKTASQNMELALRVQELGDLKTEILIGHSRKRFLDPEGQIPAASRDLETAILTAHLANRGVDYVRVHAPGIQARALRLGSRLG